MRRYRLEFDQHGDHRVVKIAEGETIRLGRTAVCDVVLSHGLVSGIHAEAKVDEIGLVLTDLNSKNGTWINREQIAEPRRVEHGDIVALGPVQVRIAVEGHDDETTVSFKNADQDRTEVVTSIDTSQSLLEATGQRAETFRLLEQASRSLAVIHEVGNILLTATSEGDLCILILDLLFDVFPADRACLVSLTDRGELAVRAARSRQAAGEITVSRTIIEQTIGKGLSLLTSDAGSDKRFREGQSIILQGIQAAMCVPMRGKSRILGALYVDTQLERGVFQREDLELLSTLGILSGVALENLQLTRQNLQAERLAAIGGVMAGLSHDIRNIMVALRSGAFMLDSIIAGMESADLGEAWDLVRDGTDTIGRLVEDMVSYSKEREPMRDPTDLSALISFVCDRYRASTKEHGAELVVDLAPDLGSVLIEETAIDRVLSNLIGNALDAVGWENGRILVRTLAPDPEHIAILVRDNGPGIDPENRERIFDLLFSTKGSKGTGFGLAISRKIVHEHGGTIVVESEPGAGAEFRVTLPRA